MNPQDFEIKVLRAVQSMVDKGWSIEIGCFGEAEEQSCCPLTAFLLEELGPDIFDLEGLIDLEMMDSYLESLGVPPLASEAFWEGYDLTNYLTYEFETDWYQAGKRVREKLVSLEYLV